MEVIAGKSLELREVGFPTEASHAKTKMSQRKKHEALGDRTSCHTAATCMSYAPFTPTGTSWKTSLPSCIGLPFQQDKHTAQTAAPGHVQARGQVSNIPVKNIIPGTSETLRLSHATGHEIKVLVCETKTVSITECVPTTVHRLTTDGS